MVPLPPVLGADATKRQLEGRMAQLKQLEADRTEAVRAAEKALDDASAARGAARPSPRRTPRAPGTPRSNGTPRSIRSSAGGGRGGGSTPRSGARAISRLLGRDSGGGGAPDAVSDEIDRQDSTTSSTAPGTPFTPRVDTNTDTNMDTKTDIGSIGNIGNIGNGDSPAIGRPRDEDPETPRFHVKFRAPEGDRSISIPALQPGDHHTKVNGLYDIL